jgi:hypothetical protein
MAIITTPGAGVSPYETTTTTPTVLRASADGSTVSTSAAAAASTVTELAAATANTLVVVSGQAALNSLITSNQPGVFEGANVTINLEEQNFNTTNQVTSTINSPSGNTGEIQYNSGANSFASDAYFTYTNSNVITPGIRTNNYLYANGAPFLAGGNAAIGNFVFTGDNMTISDSNQTINITGNGTGNINVTANSTNTWTFDNVGNLILPGNTFAVKYANGDPVVISAGGLPLANGTSNIDIATANGNVTITANGSPTWTFNTDGNLTLPTAGNIVGAVNIIGNGAGNLDIVSNGRNWSFKSDGNLVLPIAGNIVNNGYVWNFGNDGVLTTPGISGDITGANLIGTVSISASGNIFGNNINSNYDLSAFGNVYANSVAMDYLVSSANLEVSGSANVGTLSTVGSVSATGNITSLSAMYSGNGATSQLQVVALANVLFVGADVAEAYVQAAMINTGGNGSSDWVSYSNNGNTDQGWIDMGVTGNTFNDPDYEITDPNDGYILVEGTNVSGTPLGGNLILATGNIGLAHDIVFATGGFAHANIKARLIDSTGEFSVVGNIAANNLSATNLVINSITSDDSTFVTIEDGLNVNGEISATGNITGNYFIGNGSQLTDISANTGNVTFRDEIVIGTGTSNLISGLYLAPSSSSANANMYLRVRGNIVDEPTHIHFDTGNNAYYNQFIGDDNKYIQLANTGNIVINSNDVAGNAAQWNFDTTGNLTFPTGNLVIIPDYAAESNAAIISSTDHVLGLVSTGVNGGVQSVWVEDVANIFTSNTAAVRVSPISQIGNVQIQTGNNSSINTWNFGTDGNLTLPSSLIVPANSIITGEAGSPAASINGFNNIDAIAFSASGNVTANNGMFTNIVNVASHTGAVVSVSGNITGGNILTGGLISATGNISAGNLIVTGIVVDNTANLDLQTTAANGNINLITAGTGIVATAASFSATGNVSAGNLNITGNIVDTGALTIITGSNGNIALTPNGTGNVTTGANVSVTGNITSGNLSVTGNVTGTTAGFTIGYLNVPQVAFTGDATIAATDAGKHYYSTLSAANVLTIANNTSVSWAVGTAISLVNRGTGNITVAQGSGVSLYLAGNATAGNRTVTTYGMATLLNVATNVWMINGTGVS